MSREPSSPVHRYREALGRAGALDPPPPQPKPRKPKRRNFRVTVPPKRDPESTRERAFTRWATSTERLTTDERALLRELRQTDRDNGVTEGTTAKGSAARIQAARKGEDTHR